MRKLRGVPEGSGGPRPPAPRVGPGSPPQLCPEPPAAAPAPPESPLPHKARSLFSAALCSRLPGPRLSLLTPSSPSLVPVGRGLVSSHLSTQHSLPHLEGHRLPGGLRVRLSGFPSRACAWFSRRGQDDRAAVLQTRAVPWEDPGGPCPTGRVRSPTGQKQRAS